MYLKSAINGPKLVKTQPSKSALSHMSLQCPFHRQTAALYKTPSAKETQGVVATTLQYWNICNDWRSLMLSFERQNEVMF